MCSKGIVILLHESRRDGIFRPYGASRGRAGAPVLHISRSYGAKILTRALALRDHSLTYPDARICSLAIRWHSANVCSTLTSPVSSRAIFWPICVPMAGNSGIPTY